MIRRTRQSARRRAERGFTVIELIVVMGISLFGVAGLLSVYSTTSQANRLMGKGAEAIEICEESVEELRSFSIDKIEAMPGYGAITTAGWGPVDFHEGDSVGRGGTIFRRQVAAQQTAASSSLVKLRVSVQWVDDGSDPRSASADRIHEVILEMIRTREELL